MLPWLERETGAISSGLDVKFLDIEIFIIWFILLTSGYQQWCAVREYKVFRLQTSLVLFPVMIISKRIVTLLSFPINFTQLVLFFFFFFLSFFLPSFHDRKKRKIKMAVKGVWKNFYEMLCSISLWFIWGLLVDSSYITLFISVKRKKVFLTPFLEMWIVLFFWLFINTVIMQ